MDVSSGLAPTRPLVQAILPAADRKSVLSQLGAIKVPSANAVGAAATGAASVYWAGEQLAKPLPTLQFAALSLPALKVAAQVALTDELTRLATTDSLNVTEHALTSAAAAALDSALLDPANAGNAGVKPASLTNGVSTTAPLLDFKTRSDRSSARFPAAHRRIR